MSKQSHEVNRNLWDYSHMEKNADWAVSVVVLAFCAFSMFCFGFGYLLGRGW